MFCMLGMHLEKEFLNYIFMDCISNIKSSICETIIKTKAQIWKMELKRLDRIALIIIGYWIPHIGYTVVVYGVGKLATSMIENPFWICKFNHLD